MTSRLFFSTVPLFPPGNNQTPYRKLASARRDIWPYEFIRVERGSFAEQAMRDINPRDD